MTDIVERHALQAASAWHIRASATRSPLHDLGSLGRVDERVEANMDGLRIAGQAGREICRTALELPGAGEVFVATVLAIEREDVRTFADILARFGRTPELARGIVSALGWVPFTQAERLLREMTAPNAPVELHYFSIAGHALHRRNPGEPLEVALQGDDLRLRARALRACGELRRVDLLAGLRRGLDAEGDACRFWAAWSAALLGDSTAHDVLWTIACAESPFSEAAADMMFRCMDEPSALRRAKDLAGAAGKTRSALKGIAALGDPAMIPWVIEQMALPRDARLAGWCLGQITGVDLHAQRLSNEKPLEFRAGPNDDPGDSNVAWDPDTGLSWPDLDGVRRWWASVQSSFPSGERFLLGRRLDREWCWSVLRAGPQPARAAASIDLVRRWHQGPLFEVRAPTLRQQHLLSGEQRAN